MADLVTHMKIISDTVMILHIPRQPAIHSAVSIFHTHNYMITIVVHIVDCRADPNHQSI
jgi:hypothetical protein